MAVTNIITQVLKEFWRRLMVNEPEDKWLNCVPTADGTPVVRGRMNDEEAVMPWASCCTDEYERLEER